MDEVAETQSPRRSLLDQLRPRGFSDWLLLAAIGAITLVPVIRSEPDWWSGATFAITYFLIYIESHLRILRSPRAERIYGAIGRPLVALIVVFTPIAIAVFFWFLASDGDPWMILLFAFSFIVAAAWFVILKF